MGYDDRQDPTWRAINRAYDRKTDKKISDLGWRIQKSYLEGRRLDHEIERLRSKESYSNAFEDDYDKETDRLRNLSFVALRNEFRNNCTSFAQWIEESHNIPASERERLAKFLKALWILHPKTGQLVKEGMAAIDKEKKRVANDSALHHYLMELYDCWQGFHYLGRMVAAWNWKLKQE